jgi:hypothetical protein
MIRALIARHTIVPVLLSLVLMVVISATHAARTMEDGKGNSVRLSDEPCVSTAGVLATMPEKARKDFKAATIRWEDKDYAGCWTDTGTHYFIIDESGDNGHVNKRAFKEDVSA